MRLRTRVLLLVFAAAAVSGLVAYVAIERLLLSSFEALERNVVRAETERARNALLDGRTALAASNADWANWDELHAALGSDFSAFAAGYFVPVSFTSLDIAHLAVLDRNGKVLAAAGFDPATNKLLPIPPDYTAALQKLQRLYRESGRPQLTGVLRTSVGPELVAIHAALPMTGTAASRGDVVLTRALDAHFAESLTGLLRRDIALLPPSAWPAGTDEPVHIDLHDERHAWGLFRIDDFDGEPALVGRIAVPRDIHAQAGDTLSLLAIVILIIVLLAPVGAEFVINRLVVSRVLSLRDWAREVAGGGLLAPPIATDSRDELGELASSIASMAVHLEGVQKDLELAREQADRANRAKSDFLAGASHEIRTPLTAILGYAELLQDRRLRDDEYARYLNTIRSNGEDLLGILNDILDLSKIEAGRLDLSWEKSDLRAVLAGVLTLLRIKADARGLTLTLIGDDDLPLRAFIDPVRFRQILVNLVGNGIRYTDRGNVTVSCRVDRSNPVNARLFVDVRDTGVGMDAAQIARLFQPFTQLGYGGARRAGGTGLGLALSQEFARAMGGSIRVQSEPGKGSTFTLDLPLGDLTGVPLAGSVPMPVDDDTADTLLDDESFAGRKVFLVEDNPVNRLLVEKLLERLDVAVASEGDGKAALDHLLESGEHYDLVLLDMHLPSLDGYGIIRRLRIANYRGIVVALTASAMAGERERALHAGCDDFIAKPLQSRAFLRTCRDWLRKARSA